MATHIPSMPDDHNGMFPSVEISHTDEWRMTLRSEDPEREATIPGLWIKRRSAIVVPGSDCDFNTVTVTLFAADVTVDDRARGEVKFATAPIVFKTVADAQLAVARKELELAEARQVLAQLGGR